LLQTGTGVVVGFLVVGVVVVVGFLVVVVFACLLTRMFPAIITDFSEPVF
jgi:hypothetical protein